MKYNLSQNPMLPKRYIRNLKSSSSGQEIFLTYKSRSFITMFTKASYLALP